MQQNHKLQVVGKTANRTTNHIGRKTANLKRIATLSVYMKQSHCIIASTKFSWILDIQDFPAEDSYVKKL